MVDASVLEATRTNKDFFHVPTAVSSGVTLAPYPFLPPRSEGGWGRLLLRREWSGEKKCATLCVTAPSEER